LAAKAAEEWRRIGKPEGESTGVPGAEPAPGELRFREAMINLIIIKKFSYKHTILHLSKVYELSYIPNIAVI